MLNVCRCKRGVSIYEGVTVLSATIREGDWTRHLKDFQSKIVKYNTGQTFELSNFTLKYHWKYAKGKPEKGTYLTMSIKSQILIQSFRFQTKSKVFSKSRKEKYKTYFPNFPEIYLLTPPKEIPQQLKFQVSGWTCEVTFMSMWNPIQNLWEHMRPTTKLLR